MSLNTEAEVKNFIIESVIKAERESSHCEVKRERKDRDFVDYVKWVPFRLVAGSKRVDVRAMIIDYFESDKEHYFEIRRRLDVLKAEIKTIKANME